MYKQHMHIYKMHSAKQQCNEIFEHFRKYKNSYVFL